MLYTKSARCWQNILARHWPGIVCTAARYWPNTGIFVICRNDAVMRPVYIKQHWLYTGKAASAQYRPITLQYRPDAGPMLYAELARCRHYAIGAIGTSPMLDRCWQPLPL